MTVLLIKNLIFRMFVATLLAAITAHCAAQNPLPDTALIANLARQRTYNTDSVYVVPDAAFAQKPVRRWLLGDHYRKVWITPVRVPVIDLDTLFGGMKVKKEGGGMQTKSLQLQAAQTKKEWAIRTIEKFPERALPEELAGTIAAEFLKDQISSAHPYAPLVVDRLATAAGIYHSNPHYVFVKRSPALDSFAADFGNQFYLMEERPQGDWEGTEIFGNADKITGWEKASEYLADPAYQIDSKAFLRARLLDIFIGDWDRHEDQWTWSIKKQDGIHYMRPIPKDRDQAFAKLDGVIPWIGTRKWALRRAQYFEAEIKDLKGLVWSGRKLDRLILVDLEWPQWEAEAKALQQAWTTEIIAQAVQRLPAPVRALTGKEIEEKLRRRRDDLVQYVKAYYDFLSEEVEWVGTAKKDSFAIEAIDDNTFTAKQFAWDSGSTILKKSRTFYTAQTKELRLYGLAGDDVFKVSGDIAKTRIRLIGEGGANDYKSATNDKQRRITVYDTAFEKKDAARKFFRVNNRPDSLTQRYNYGLYTYNVLSPVVLPGYNPDDGVYVGGGVNYKVYKWGKPGVAQEHRMGANYAFRTGAYNFLYEGFFGQAVGRWNLLANAYLNQPNFVYNFYGLGNNTELIKKDRTYNRVRVAQIIAQAGLQRTFAARHNVAVLSEFLSTKVQNSDQRFVSVANPALDSSDFERLTWYGGTATYAFTSKDNRFFPTKGVEWKTSLRYMHSPRWSDNFLNVQSEFSFFIPLGKLVWASRIGGARLTGKPQFFQYNQLSGLTNLRGFRRSRFYGESMVYNNNELRIPIATLQGYILRGKAGITLFSDNGRVWFPGEDSERWHVGYGGGVWIVPYQRISFTANYGVSKEDAVLYVKAGFLF